VQDGLPSLSCPLHSPPAHSTLLLPPSLSSLLLVLYSCGLRINMRPFHYLLERGVAPLEAYSRTYKTIMRDMEFRTWYRGTALGDAGEHMNHHSN
jgi:hypothetical protein